MESPSSPTVGTPDPLVAAAALVRLIGAEPFKAVLVLGSGLGRFAGELEDPSTVPFDALPGLPRAGVAGHEGRWVGGRLEGRRVLIQAGRYHAYEGLPSDVVCAPVRIAAALGIRILVLTNAAGGVRRPFAPGTLVALKGHLDLMGGTLRAVKRSVRVGADRPYDPELVELAGRSAELAGVALERGVYAALRGPSYETPAEIRMCAHLGADLVGMSTVPEAVAGRAAGMRCLGLSLVTNWAAGVAPVPLAHEDVLETGRRSAAAFERLLRGIVRELPGR